MYMHATFYLPQVLAVNILGRFLLNNDRNIRLVLFGFSLTSSPPPHSCFSFHLFLHPSSLISAGHLYHFHSTRPTANSLQPERTLPTGCCQSELTNHFPWSRSSRAKPEGHCLSVNADLFILGSVNFHQAVWRPETGSFGFCYVTIFWVYLHRGCVTRQACQVFTGGPLNVSLAV